jgi:hypothetical protein
MAVAVIAEFKMGADQVRTFLGDAKSIYEECGGTCTLYREVAGNSGATWSVMVSFPDWETYGSAMAKLANDDRYQAVLREVGRAGTLVAQRVLVQTTP